MTQSYACQGFHSSFDRGKASGSLTVTSFGFDFHIGDKSGHIPYTGAALTLGGASDRLVFLSHPSFSDWSIYTSDLTILNNSKLLEHAELLPQIRRAKNSRLKNLAVFLIVSALIIAVPSFLIFKMDVATHIIVKQIPVEWEQKLAETTLAQIKIDQEFMDEDEADELLKPLTKALLDQLHESPYSFDFYIVNDSTLNAFALPGGIIVINSGLIIKANSAEELLGVVGHEITHVTEQHGLRNLVGSLGIYLTVSALLGDVNGLLGVIISASPMLLNMSYSRKFETESDVKGVELLHQAKIDPRGFITFFKRLLEEERERLKLIDDEDTRAFISDAMSFISTHPATQQRIEQLTLLTAGYSGEYINLQSDFNQLKTAIQQFVTSTSQEPSIDEN